MANAAVRRAAPEQRAAPASAAVANRLAPSEVSVPRQSPGRAVPAAVANSGGAGEWSQPRPQMLASSVASAAANNLATLERPRQRARLAAAPVADSIVPPGQLQQRVRGASAATVASIAANNLAALDPPRQRARLAASTAADAISNGVQWNGRDARWRRDLATAIATNTLVVPSPVQVSSILPPVNGLPPARWRVPRDLSAVSAPIVVLSPNLRSVPSRLVLPPPLVGGPLIASGPSWQDPATFIPQQAFLGAPLGGVRDPFAVLRPPWHWGPDPLARLGPLFRGASDPFLWLRLPPANLNVPVAQPLLIAVPVPVPAPVPTFAWEMVPVSCVGAPPPLLPGLFGTASPHAGPDVCPIGIPMMAPSVGFPFPADMGAFMPPPFPPVAPSVGLPFPAAAGAFAPQPFPPLAPPAGFPFPAGADAFMPQPFTPGTTPAGFPLYPPPPGAIMSPFGEAPAPALLQDAPLRLLSQQRGDYPVENLLPPCDGYSAWVCDDAAGQPPTIAVGLGTSGSETPASSSPQPTPASATAAPTDEEPEAGGAAYALVHPLLLCEGEEAEVCDEDSANELAAVAPGFAISVMDGPDGFGIYLTYADPAEAEADDEAYALVHPLLLCEGEEADGCDEDSANELAAVAPGFAISVMDGPDGFGIYLTYADPAELIAAQVAPAE